MVPRHLAWGAERVEPPSTEKTAVGGAGWGKLAIRFGYVSSEMAARHLIDV